MSADSKRKLTWRQKYALIRELAEGALNQTELGEKYGISNARVSQINSEERERIEAMRADLDNEYAGIWIADKANRVRTYDALAERLTEALEDETDSQLVRQLVNVQKAVAEEMGQLPSRVTVNIEKPVVHHVIEGVDPGDVK